jgi:putative membrane protein
MRKNLIGIAVIATLAACSGPPASNETASPDANEIGSGNMASSSMNNAMTPPVADAPTDAADYLAKAGAGDLFEIQSSNAVLAKTGNAAVKMFANMMIDHHTKSTEKLTAAAKADGVPVSPPALDPLQQSMLDEIKAASADKIDAVYKTHQAKAHNAALALHRGYAAQGDKPALKRAAGEIVPVVQKHIEELGKLPG